jgi:tryptophan-rich sensory protein
MEIKFILKNKYFQITIAILIPLILGWITSMIAMSRKEPFYFDLEKPAYTPPEWVGILFEFLCFVNY